MAQFLDALIDGKYDVCRTMLGEGYDVNTIMSNEHTALTLACCEAASLEVISFLVNEAHADINKPNEVARPQARFQTHILTLFVAVQVGWCPLICASALSGDDRERGLEVCE